MWSRSSHCSPPSKRKENIEQIWATCFFLSRSRRRRQPGRVHAAGKADAPALKGIRRAACRVGAQGAAVRLGGRCDLPAVHGRRLRKKKERERKKKRMKENERKKKERKRMKVRISNHHVCAQTRHATDKVALGAARGRTHAQGDHAGAALPVCPAHGWLCCRSCGRRCAPAAAAAVLQVIVLSKTHTKKKEEEMNE